jgi:serine/threonine protein phosphatase PrpC
MTSAIMHMQAGLHTVPGRRSSNQDAVVGVVLPDGRELVAVADGMGGHRAGEVASQRALEALVAGLQAGHSLYDAITEANGAVYAAAQENASWAGMGTTLVAMLRAEDRYDIANVGDSRAYRITKTGIQQITKDHSFVAEAAANGHGTATAAQQSRWKNALTRALGTDAQVEVDLFGPFDVEQPHTVLLCSDGLHGSVSQQTIRHCLTHTPEPNAAAQRLADEAYRGGSNDNISAAVIVFQAGAASAERKQRRLHRENMPVISRAAHVVLIPAPRGSGRDRSWLNRFFSLIKGDV